MPTESSQETTLSDAEEEVEDFPEEQKLYDDVVEWWCFRVLHAESPDLVERYSKALESAIDARSHSVGKFQNYGRVYNRMQMAALVYDIVLRDSLLDVNLRDWKMIEKQLQHVKERLIRRDANEEECNETNEEINEETASLNIFTEEMEAVVVLLKIHKAAAGFREALVKLQTGKVGERTLRTQPSGPPLKQIEAAVDTYKKSLSQLNIDIITKPLTSFLLPDLYKKKGNSDLVQRLLDDLNDVLSDDKTSFSSALTSEKFRFLLRSWDQQALVVPTLVQLGYGGIQPPAPPSPSTGPMENVSVSSWGGNEQDDDEEEEEEEEKEKQEPAAVSPKAIRRQKSEDEDISGYLTPDEDMDEEPLATQPAPPEQVPDSPIAPTQDNDADGDDEQSDEEEEEANEKQTPHRRSSRTTASARRKRSVSFEGDRSDKDDENQDKEQKVPEEANVNQEDSDDENIPEPESSPPKKKTQPRKKRKVLVEWEDSSSEEDEEEAPKRRMSFPAPAPWQQRLPPRPRQSLSPSLKKPQKRRFFTDEEKSAIKEGVRRFGVGNWAMIRLNSDGVLLSRRPQQLKDCYRNMEKRNEV